MNKRFLILPLTAVAFILSGCQRIGGISNIYAVATLLAGIMLIGYSCAIPKKNPWFALLFIAILVVNSGYLLLSVSGTLKLALWANRLAYLGSVFLPVAMLMIIFKAARINFKKWLPPALLVLAAAVFLITATPGWLPWYYKEVTLVRIDGVTTLNKVYGPLHCLYLFYLLGYFSTMVTAIVYVNLKKKLDSAIHAVALTVAVFINLGVWAIEQVVDLQFEILSLSYIICEMFLLVLQIMMLEQEKLKAQLWDQTATATKKAAPVQTPEQLALFKQGIAELTKTENTIFALYIQGLSTKQVMEQLHITENTLKFHNKNIYSKLGVSSRKQLLALHSQLEHK